MSEADLILAMTMSPILSLSIMALAHNNMKAKYGEGILWSGWVVCFVPLANVFYSLMAWVISLSR